MSVLGLERQSLGISRTFLPQDMSCKPGAELFCLNLLPGIVSEKPFAWSAYLKFLSSVYACRLPYDHMLATYEPTSKKIKEYITQNISTAGDCICLCLYLCLCPRGFVLANTKWMDKIALYVHFVCFWVHLVHSLAHKYFSIFQQ